MKLLIASNMVFLILIILLAIRIKKNSKKNKSFFKRKK